VTTAYHRVARLAEICDRITELGARTAVVDIEPLVAFWDTDRSTLQHGVTTVLDRLTSATAVRAVVFATNSARTLPSTPAIAGVRVGYVASAGKPLRTAPYARLPEPGVVIGDQVATDGVLAWRLGYAFLHYCPALPHVPRGPRLLSHLGRPIRAILFRGATP
jgi:predicted HAD superfamily phosphohydrolase YqeG